MGDGALIGVFAGWGGEHKKPSPLVSDQGGGFLCSRFDIRVRVLGGGEGEEKGRNIFVIYVPRLEKNLLVSKYCLVGKLMVTLLNNV